MITWLVVDRTVGIGLSPVTATVPAGARSLDDDPTKNSMSPGSTTYASSRPENPSELTGTRNVMRAEAPAASVTRVNPISSRTGRVIDATGSRAYSCTTSSALRWPVFVTSRADLHRVVQSDRGRDGALGRDRERGVAETVTERIQRFVRLVDVGALPMRPATGDLVCVEDRDLPGRPRVGDGKLASGARHAGQHVGDRPAALLTGKPGHQHCVGRGVDRRRPDWAAGDEHEHHGSSGRGDCMYEVFLHAGQSQ